VIKKKRRKSYAKILKKYRHMEVQEEREKIWTHGSLVIYMQKIMMST
jgi:hypothetical protein